MRVLTVLGTRPEIIRLSRVMAKIDEVWGQHNHRICFTGQNWDPKLSSDFFTELELRSPDYYHNARSSSLSQQLSQIFVSVEKAIEDFRPDKVLILGDTNSGLSAVICERLGIPVYHMEAGNRCYDHTVPEERNRRVIDSICSVNLPYTELSRQNLLREGCANDKIFVTGNPIAQVIAYYQDQISRSDICQRLQVRAKNYVIATAHRAENVDDPIKLTQISRALKTISASRPVIFSCHPRTQQKLSELKVDFSHSDVRICQPLGFFDFVNLEQNSYCAVTDSGTVQEEMCVFQIPTITIRRTTERPETVWCGSNMVSGLCVDEIIRCYEAVSVWQKNWAIPQGYEHSDVSQKIVNILSSGP